MTKYGLLVCLCSILAVLGNAYAEEGAGVTIGTAFFINAHGDMLTNRHVVEGCRKIYVKTKDGAVSEAELIVLSREFDLAAIRAVGLTPPSHAQIKIDRDRYIYLPADNMPLLYGGYDNEYDRSFVNISNGKATAIPDSLNPDQLHISSMIAGSDHGASGSAVFDHTGSLMGIVFGGYIDQSEAYLGRSPDVYYGNNIVLFYNNVAIVKFLHNEAKVTYSSIIDPPIRPRLQSVGLIYAITALVICSNPE